MPISRLLWGDGFENQLVLEWPLFDILTDRAPRDGSQIVQAPSGATDAWVTGWDYTLDGEARWIRDASETYTPISGARGWHEFLSYCREGGELRFVPDVTYPDFYLPGTYLVEPQRGFGVLTPDLQRRVSLKLRNASYDFHLALRGLMMEYRPGGRLTDWTFARSTAGLYRGVDGLLASAIAAKIRDRHYEGTTRTTLLEAARTNVVLWNRDCTNAAWTKTNITAAKDQTGADGVATSASSLTATAANGTCLQAITLASSARYQSAYVKRIIGSGTIEMTMDNGATWTAITVTAAWTRVTIATQTLANPTVGLRIVSSGDAIAVDYVQNEDSGTVASSAIATTSAAVTRGADALSRAWIWKPQAMFMYRKWVELGDGIAGAPSYLQSSQIANGASSGARFQQIISGGGSGGYYVERYNAVAVSRATSTSSAPVVGDVVDLLAILHPDGSVEGKISFNGGAESTLTRSSALALGDFWGTSASEAIRFSPGTPLYASGIVAAKAGPLTFAGVTRDTIAQARAA